MIIDINDISIYIYIYIGKKDIHYELKKGIRGLRAEPLILHVDCIIIQQHSNVHRRSIKHSQILVRLQVTSG